MKTLVEDAELTRLRQMALGEKPFRRSGLWERLAGLEQKEYMQLPPRERLACGYYEAAKRRAAQMQEVA